ncbi:U11/U12 small nuclear ribonucleoprotein 48 kDa protein-like [Diabrotica undecimpunctata]|uniref:U11/U12 small nuclear ribonucleoprotein 48 kDa protein-like n=1 Tax=Diabrotica undecimpunctata TaxID=50387 RepID=UPI003B635A4A
MSFNIEVRKKQLHSLNQYINSTKDKIDSILNYLGWTAKSVLDASDSISCPLNKKHIMPIEKIEEHVQKCSLISSSYKTNEDFLSETPKLSSTLISLDLSKKMEIFNEAQQQNSKFKSAWNQIEPDPKTSDRLFSTYSPDERLAIYDYCVQNTEGPPVPEEICMNIKESNRKEDTTPTAEEELKKQRDAKRRPVKYKSVHTSRSKSYIEIMREVIQNQTDMYKDYLMEKQKEQEEIERKRQQEILEKAETYEQFPHIDSRVVYDYGLDPYEIENSINGNVSVNVTYDYSVELPLRIENNCEQHELHMYSSDGLSNEARSDYKSSNGTSCRDKYSRKSKNRDEEHKRRHERRSKERKKRDFDYRRRSREDRRGSYVRSEKKYLQF